MKWTGLYIKKPISMLNMTSCAQYAKYAANLVASSEYYRCTGSYWFQHDLACFQIIPLNSSPDNIQVEPDTGHLWIGCSPGARLTKTYDVTIQRYRKSHAKIQNSKMLILRCMGSKFCVKFQRCLWNFTQKFEPLLRKICILRGGKKLTTHDILELWHLKS